MSKKLSSKKLCIATAASFFVFFILSSALDIVLDNVTMLLQDNYLTSIIKPFLRDFLCFTVIILLLAFLTYGKQFSAKIGKIICLSLLITFLANLIVYVLQWMVIDTGSVFVISIEEFFEPLITCLIPVVFIMLFVFGIKINLSFKSFLRFPNILLITVLFGLMLLCIFLELLHMKAQIDTNILNQGIFDYINLMPKSPYRNFLDILKPSIHFLFICVPIFCIYNETEVS